MIQLRFLCDLCEDGRRKRKGKPYPGRCIANGAAASILRQYFLDEVKPKPAAAGFSVSGLFDTVKGIEQLWQAVVWDMGIAVFNAKLNRALFRSQENAYFRFLRRIFDGIADQV